MKSDLLHTDEALSYIDDCKNNRIRIESLDGFHVVGDKFMENVDLMFTSDQNDDAARSAENARKFILENGSPTIVWEIFAQ